jgi:class 3 adenylate cyclase
MRRRTNASSRIAASSSTRRSAIIPGRIVKTTGDGMLAEFLSVVDAVRCAAVLQRAMIDREAGMPDDRRIRFRIGINRCPSRPKARSWPHNCWESGECRFEALRRRIR